MAKSSINIVTHRAILIGIDLYPSGSYSEHPLLKGCVNDVREIKTHLEKLPARADVQILTASLTDGDKESSAQNKQNLPTYSNVVSGLEKILFESSRGDFVYVHFSGHGTAMEPKGEFSNRSTGDLALVLLEGLNGDRIRYLRGEELAGLLHGMVEKGLAVTVVLDCCFSGSVMRNNHTVRFLSYDPEVDMAYPPVAYQKPCLESGVIPSASRSVSMSSNWLINPEGYTVYTACGPTEIAHEIDVSGQKHGALSYFLTRAFTRYGRVGGRHQHVYAHICARFREACQKQAPMLYGNKNLGFFEVTSYALNSIQIPIMRTKDGCLQLQAGEAHGVANGDEFALHDMGFDQAMPESRHDSVAFEVTEVGGLTSKLNPIGLTTASALSGLTAITLTRLSLRTMSVCLDLRLSSKIAWETALRKRKSLDVQYIADVNPGSKFTFYVTVTSKDHYEIRDRSQRVISNLPAVTYDLEENADSLLDVVEHLLMFEMVGSLENRSSAPKALEFEDSFKVQLFDTAGKVFLPGCCKTGCSHPECLVEVEHGAKVTLVVENKASEGGQSLYLHLYNMSSDWEIENSLRGDHDEIPPRRSNKSGNFLLGTNGEWKKDITMTVQQEVRNRGFNQCEDILKLFLTAQPTSFMSLELPEVGKFMSKAAVSRDSQQGMGPLSENWVALNFHIRTSVKE